LGLINADSTPAQEVTPLDCTHEDTADGIRIIRLLGRMDMEGAVAIDPRFATLVATGGKAIVVDLSGVDFLGSLGMGTLVMAAKNVAARKGLMVMCAASGAVERALIRTNLPIPLWRDLGEARQRVMAAAGG
jgi:anti-sigma B factor antagonist